jgi:hypothetical protein
MPTTVKISAFLLYLIALCWFIFSLLTFGNVFITIPSGFVRWAIGIITLICSIITAMAAYFLTRRNRMIYLATIGLLVMLIIGSFMDELGWSDAALIVITATTLGLLIKDRAWFFPPDNAGKEPLNPYIVKRSGKL